MLIFVTNKCQVRVFVTYRDYNGTHTCVTYSCVLCSYSFDGIRRLLMRVALEKGDEVVNDPFIDLAYMVRVYQSFSFGCHYRVNDWGKISHSTYCGPPKQVPHAGLKNCLEKN